MENLRVSLYWTSLITSISSVYFEISKTHPEGFDSTDSKIVIASSLILGVTNIVCAKFYEKNILTYLAILPVAYIIVREIIDYKIVAIENTFGGNDIVVFSGLFLISFGLNLLNYDWSHDK